MSTQSRRNIARAFGGGLALLVSVGVGARKADRRKKKPKFRTVTKTFTNALPITIPDQSPADLYPSPIQVSGFKDGKLLDVNVRLRRFSHDGFPGDVDVLLVAPNGRKAIILSDTGSNDEVNDLNLILDDQAAASLPDDGSRLGSGRFKPTNRVGGDIIDEFPPPAPAGTTKNVKLATFNGINPNGIWRLFAVDDSVLGGGSFGTGWSLTIKARVRK